MNILVDTREQKPYEFPDHDVENVALKTGDYTVNGGENVAVVERKSLDDLAHSLGSDRDRFEREVVRGQDLHEFHVVVEATKSHVRNEHYYPNIHPNSIFGTVEKWPLKYGTLQFHWAGNREGGRQKTLDLLTEWNTGYQPF